MTVSAISGDEVTIEHGGQRLVLRPTLRAGIAAYGLQSNFAQLLTKLAELDTVTISALLGIGSVENPSRLLYGESLGMGGLSDIADKLIDYSLILANGGVRPKPEDTAQPATGAVTSHADYFARLFKLGTGWLGWSPDETLNAPMPAILSAYIGRQEMLRSIFGGSSASAANTISLDDKVRMAASHFVTRKVKRS